MPQKQLLLLFVIMLSSSCVRFTGQFEVKDNFMTKIKTGFLNLKTKEIEIKKDSYRASLNINNNKSISINLEGHENISLPIKSKNNFNLPQTGNFTISHKDSNQPFDITGHIETKVTLSDYLNAIEVCTWVQTERHCQKVCDSNTSCRSICENEAHVFYGQRSVAFRNKITHRDLSITLLKQDSEEELANFQGISDDFDRVYGYVGTCR